MRDSGTRSGWSCFCRRTDWRNAVCYGFLGAAGHDTGDFDLYHFVEVHQADFLPHVVAFNWLDHMAASDAFAPPGLLIVRGMLAAFNAPLRDIVAQGMALFGIPTEPSLGPISSIGHLPGYVPSYNVTLAPPWYHTREDTLETVPPEDLARMAAAQRVVLDRLLEADGDQLRAAQPSPEPIPSEGWDLPDGCGP